MPSAKASNPIGKLPAGRSPRDTTRVSVRLEADILSRLKSIAHEMGLPVAIVATFAVCGYVVDYERKKVNQEKAIALTAQSMNDVLKEALAAELMKPEEMRELSDELETELGEALGIKKSEEQLDLYGKKEQK